MTRTNHEGTVVDAKASVLSYLFYTGKFEVPWHQRYYDWTKEHVSELLYDLDEAFRENRNCYFLGAVMLVKKANGIWEINDGQQRMVTFSLICARLARIFRDEVDTRREALALRIFFDLDENHTRDLSEADELTPRLSPPRNDKTNYNLLIRDKDVSTNGKLTTAWGEIDKHFLAMDPDKAKKFFDFIINKLEVACLFVPKELDPSSVFETLNARGKPLGDLDLIRNYFYSFFSGAEEESRRDTVHDSLERVRAQLREERSQTKALEYMRCYLQCKYGFLPKDRLYREMKGKIKVDCNQFSPSNSADYVFNLVEDISSKDRVEVFHAISSPSENGSLIEHFLRDSSQSGSLQNLFIFLCELKTYTVTQPIVFAFLNRYVQENNIRKKKGMARFVHNRLKLLTSFVMRTTLVATKFEPSRFESAFSALAQKIMSAAALDSIPFACVLRDVDDYGVFDNSNFIEKMEQTTIRHQTKAKRFLLGLAYHQQPDDIAIINERRYTVEHILPESATHLSGWSNFDQRVHADNIYRIGNLTLLGSADNKPGPAFNGSFSEKKDIYRNSIISLTQEISEIPDWSIEEIQKRQKQLAKLAARVWELPNEQ
ncbi:MAG: DUF262 domain-containing protein [Gemmatimonadetes bacterium]|nr:DUF262 domain-containing protein [Gemmatimonadota bacterium]